MSALPVMRSGRTKLGRGLAVEFLLVDGSLEVEWTPRVPTPRDRRVLPKYRIARDTFLASVAEAIGGNIIVAEAP